MAKKTQKKIKVAAAKKKASKKGKLASKATAKGKSTKSKRKAKMAAKKKKAAEGAPVEQNETANPSLPVGESDATDMGFDDPSEPSALDEETGDEVEETQEDDEGYF